VQRGVGYVPEDREVFAGLSVAENLALAERDKNPRRDFVAQLFPDLVARRSQAAGDALGRPAADGVGRRPRSSTTTAFSSSTTPTKGLAPRSSPKSPTLQEASKTVPILLVEQNLDVVRRPRRRRHRHRRRPRRAHREGARHPRRRVPHHTPVGRQRGGTRMSSIVLILLTGVGLGALYSSSPRASASSTVSCTS
jgi:hypothetical protein